MAKVQNFFLCSRINTSSILEKSGDLLLTPARVLFGGRQIIVAPHSVYAKEQEISSSQWVKVVLKIIALPLAALGALIKLISLADKNFRVFLAQKITTCHPKLFEMAEHVYLTANFVSDYGDYLQFEPLNLSECGCANTRAFHRFYSPRRNNLENAIFQRMIQGISDKNQQLRLLDMGSEGLMSDFLTLEKLVLAGVKKIILDCVDPEIDVQKVERIRKFFLSYPEVSLELNAYKNIDELPAEKEEYSAVIAVDFNCLAGWDDKTAFIATADLMKAYRRLSQKGFLGLGFSDEDTLSGPLMAPVVLTPSLPFIQTLANDLASRLPEKEDLTLCIPELRFASVAPLWLYSLALAAEKAGKKFSKITLISLAEPWDQNTLPAFQTMLQSLFQTSNLEIFFKQAQNKKCDFLLTGSLEEEFKSRKYLSFLSQKAATYIFYPRGKLSRQDGDQEDKREELIRERLVAGRKR